MAYLFSMIPHLLGSKKPANSNAQVFVEDTSSGTWRELAERLDRDLANTKRQAQALKLQLTQSQDQVAIKDALLQSRTKELHAARQFMKNTNNISGAEIVEKVSSINTEINQIACIISDFFQFTKGKLTPQNADAVAWCWETLGEDMGQMLFDQGHDIDHPTAVQWALQRTMVVFCAWIASTWYFDDNPPPMVLVNIYETMRKNEFPSVTKQWERLTRRQIRLMGSPGTLQYLVTLVAGRLVEIVLAAGCDADLDHIHETFATKFSSRLTKFVKLAMELKVAISEEVSSMDVFLPHPKARERFNPGTMSTDEAIAGCRPRGVLCTAELGVHVVEWLKNNMDDWVNREELLLKPKVLLLPRSMDGIEDQGIHPTATEVTEQPACGISQGTMGRSLEATSEEADRAMEIQVGGAGHVTGVQVEEADGANGVSSEKVDGATENHGEIGAADVATGRLLDPNIAPILNGTDTENEQQPQAKTDEEQSQAEADKEQHQAAVDPPSVQPDMASQ